MKKWMLPIIIVAIIGILHFTLCNGHRREVISTGTPALQEFLSPTHEQAVVVEKPDLPDTLSHLAPLVEETITGSGYWIPDETIAPEDTLAVEISIIQGEDDDQWVRIEIEGKPAVLEELKWYEKPDELGKWSAGIETAILHDFDIGLFASRNLGELWGIRGGVAVAIDLNTDLSESPDWVVLEMRLSFPLIWDSFEVGGGIGPMFMRDNIDLSVSGGIEVRF